MEEMNLRTIIQGIQAVLKDMEYTRYMIKVTPPYKRGKYQTHVIHLRYLKRRLKDFKGRLDKKLKGTISTVKFNVNYSDGREMVAEQTFVNLTEQEIKDALELGAILENASIEILEIREIPTSIRIL
jgi:hypothetical protein